jgi:allantoinase
MPHSPQSPVDLVLRSDSVLVDGVFRPAAVSVRDGVIVALDSVDAAVPALEDRTLPEGQVLLPGIVDSHVHVNEPGRTEWEGFTTATRAAARGGVTTIIDMPLNSIPPTTTVEALDLKRAAAAPQASVDVGFWGGAIPSSLGHLRELHEAGVFGFKAFLSPSGVDEYPHLSTDQLHEAMAEITSFDGLLIVHAEDPEGLDAAPPAEGTSYAAFVRSRPDSVEQSAIDHVIDAVRSTGGRAHILHLSSAAALPAIRAAKAEGLRLTVETCPHYLSFDEGHIPDGATQYKCCPPIRDAANQELLWNALADGTIDLVASDHSPSTAALKFAGDGDFDLAWGGISGLELSFRAVWTGAAARGIPLETVVGWMSTATSDLVGLRDRGRIQVGTRADLVAFDPAATVTIDATQLAHRNPVSAFDGAELRGAIVATWLAGRVVGADAAADAGRGRLVRRP